MKDFSQLRPLTAGRLLEIWRSCRDIQDPLERVLRCNGRILADCCLQEGTPVYRDELDVLADLTGREMERLLRRLAEGGGEVPSSQAEANPAFDPARFAALGGRRE